ncbi:hypothetical protein TNCV_4165741 [Trichonephila clavipes]|nr:hypothetical protein TNCV_4165741 [Trichonephila clavipes]
MVLKANDRRTSCPCHDEFRGPRSDYVRQRQDCAKEQLRIIAERNGYRGMKTLEGQVGYYIFQGSFRHLTRLLAVAELRYSHIKLLTPQQLTESSRVVAKPIIMVASRLASSAINLASLLEQMTIGFMSGRTKASSLNQSLFHRHSHYS